MSDSCDATPWTIAHQVSLFMGFSSQEYWSGLPFPSPGDLPDPGIEPGRLHCKFHSDCLEFHNKKFQIFQIDFNIVVPALVRLSLMSYGQISFIIIGQV